MVINIDIVKIKEIIKENIQVKSQTYQYKDIFGSGKIVIQYSEDKKQTIIMYSMKYYSQDNKLIFEYRYEKNEKRWFDKNNPPPNGMLWDAKTSQKEMIDLFSDNVLKIILKEYIRFKSQHKRIQEMKNFNQQNELIKEVKNQIQPAINFALSLMMRTEEYKNQSIKESIDFNKNIPNTKK